MALLRCAAIGLIAAIAGCSGLEPGFHRCAVACGSDGSCPDGYLCADDDYCHADSEFPVESCATATEADAAAADATPPDATPPDATPPDAVAPDAEPNECDLGVATNHAAVANPALFSRVIRFANGAALPAGSYRIEYVDGCNKYAPTLWWSVHGRETGDASWWLVGASSGDGLMLLPGTVGMLPGTAGPTGDRNGFEQFDVCVAANHLVAPVVYDHAGGPLGIYQADIQYADNVSGENGRNPAWRLVYLGPCSEVVPQGTGNEG